MESKCHNFLVRQKFISFLKYPYYTCLHIYVYTKAFLLQMIKAWERTLKKTKGRDGETGEHKLNEMEALNMKQKK